MRYPHIVMSENDIARAVSRIAHEILESNKGAENLVLLGIPKRGVHIAQRISSYISRIEKNFSSEEITGILYTKQYRDDVDNLTIDSSINKKLAALIERKTVVIVDDVLYSGRTIRSGLNAIFDIARPSKVCLAVLVDRGHREVPIRADYVGKNLPTSTVERVYVKIKECDEIDEVVISE